MTPVDFQRLRGKVAVISGASRGFGQAIAVRFVEEGAKVVLLSRSACDETMKLIEAIVGVPPIAQVALWVPSDISSEADCAKVTAASEAAFGDKIDVRWGALSAFCLNYYCWCSCCCAAATSAGALKTQPFMAINMAPSALQVLINNAALFVFESVETASADDWDRSAAVNIKGHALLTKACLPYMKRAGGGSVVFQGSISSFIAQPDCATYSAMKGAIVQLARNCAYDLAKYKIRVNTVCAGTIETPISAVERASHGWTYAEWEKLKVCAPVSQLCYRSLPSVEAIAAAVYSVPCACV